MRRTSRLTPAQQAAASWRLRDGRPDKAFMSNEQRRALGLMDRQQAVEHERLTIIPHPRLAERVRGPVEDDDIWMLPGGEIR